jgi:molybdenum cofactor biosynthesis protein B
MSSQIGLNIAVLTVSDSRTVENDTSGSWLIEVVKKSQHQVIDRGLVADDKYAIRACLSSWIYDQNIDVIIATGGTGLTGRDGTPEAVLPLLDKVIDGFAEYFRYLSVAEIKTSTLQSRCFAGVANGTIIFCLPGSTNACQLAWNEIIEPQLNSNTKPCNLVDLIPRFLEK